MDPKIVLHVTTNNNYTNPQVIIMTACVKAPNAANVFSSVKFFQYQSEMKNMTIKKNVISYDSVTYTLTLVNPAPDPSVPDFHLTLRGYDGQYWQYVSNMVVFAVKPAPVVKTTLAVASGSGSAVAGTGGGGITQTPQTMQSTAASQAMQSASAAQMMQSAQPMQSIQSAQNAQGTSSVQSTAGLQWNTENEINVDSYQVLESADSVNYRTIATVKAKCNDSSKCAYFLAVQPAANQVLYYQIQTTTKDSLMTVSNIVHQGDNPAARLVLYPNPARDLVTASYTSFQDEDKASLIVYDMQGRTLLIKPYLIREGVNSLEVPVGRLANGIYIIGLEIQNKPIFVKRFVVQH
jgi:hypothetical protein